MSAEGVQELLAKVNALTKELTDALKENNLQASTFDADSPDDYEKLGPIPQIKRQILADTLQDLIWLVQGPSESIFSHANTADPMVLDVLNYFNFWSAVPLDGDASYAEIAESVSLPEEAVRRILEHAVTIRLFAKVDPASFSSRIKHTSRSAAAAKSSGLRAIVTTSLDNAAPPLSVLARALDKNQRGNKVFDQDMSKTPFSFAHSGAELGKYGSTWEFIDEDGEGARKGWRQREMVESMRWLKQSLNMHEALLMLTDWKAVGSGLVVDIGGSAGHDLFPLAAEFPDLRVNVQDLPKCEMDFNETIPEDLKGRVTFRAHNFFETQPVQGDVYLFKFIFHDWPKSEAVKILKALIPALKPGARIVVMEFVDQSPPEGVVLPKVMRKATTSKDISMMTMFGHSERKVEEVQDIFKTADERFEIVKADPASKPPMLLMELVWRS